MGFQVWSNPGVAAATILAVALCSEAAIGATPEQARAFSERAAVYIQKVGEEKAFADCSGLPFVASLSNVSVSELPLP